MHVRKNIQKRSLRVLLLSLLCFCLGMQVSFADTEKHAPEVTGDNVEAYMDAIMQALMVTSDIPATTVSVVKDGELIFAKGYGTASFEEEREVTAETSLFRIGSTSKLFTWTAVMQLYEQGLLDLGADVNTYLKDFQIPATYEQAITLKHLMTHTPGFEEGALGYLIKYSKDNALSLDAAMKKFIPARINPPGKYSSYSNYGAALAGLIVQNVSDMPFNDYVEQHIFQPLGMSRTTFDEPLPAHLAADMTQGYTRKMGVFEAQPFEIIMSFAPAGAASSTATDMAKFMQAHLNNGELNGKRILKAETAKLMHSTLFSPHEDLVGLAYGFYEHTINGHHLIGHGGDTMQFHTDMLLDKSENIGVFMSIMNTVDNKARNMFVQAFYDHFYPQEIKAVEPPTDFNQRAGEYAGEYQFWRMNESTIEKFVRVLSSPVSVIPTDKGTLYVAGPYGDSQFVEVGKDLFRQVDGKELIAFGRNAEGEVNDLYFNSLPIMALSRVPAIESSLFKLILPLLSILLFLQIIVSWFYKRHDYKSAASEQRNLIYSSLAISILNILFVVFSVLIVLIYQIELYENIPSVFGLNLVLPIVASILAFVTLYVFVKRWRTGEWKLRSKIYWLFVTLAGLYMAFYYYFWNILGWNYF